MPPNAMRPALPCTACSTCAGTLQRSRTLQTALLVLVLLAANMVIRQGGGGTG